MTAQIIPIFDAADYNAQVERAVQLLNTGGLVVLPTETVYGVAARLDRAEAVSRLRGLLSRQGDKPFTVHLGRAEHAMRYLPAEVGELGRRMMRKLWPGPVGLMFEVPAERRQAVAAELGVAERGLYDGSWITLRCPGHVTATDVLTQVQGPVVVAAPGLSSGQPALRAGDVAQDVGGKVDLILDGGEAKYSKPSTILKVLGDRYEVVRTGVYDQRIIERLLRTTILFVCSGNTCRSPMAEALARRILADRLGVTQEQLESKGINVISAGSFAMSGARATPQAVEAVKDLGADLSRHRSRPLTVELINQADVVFTMGRGHSEAVMAMVPSAADKVVTLDPAGDIDDPIGGDEALYRHLAGQMQTLIERRLSERALP